MTTFAVRTSLVVGLALTLSLTIASCGGTVRDSLGDSESGGATSVAPSATSSGSSKATGAGGKTGGVSVGAGAVSGTAGKSGGAGTVAGGGKGGGAGAIANGGKGAGPAGGKAGAAGVPAAGGTPTVDRCSGVLCAPCPVDTKPYFSPGVCCPTCVPICATIDCGILKCGPNEVATTPPGQCCPICEPLQPPDAGAPCNQSGYKLLRDALEQKYSSTPCMSDAECSVGALNVCGQPDCGFAVPTITYMSFVTNLESYALANCTGCGPVTVTCPATTPKAKCLGSYCTLVRE
jgi:hypothetical protein